MLFFVKWSYLVDPQATFSQILITETYEKNLLGQFSKLTGSTFYTYGLGLISESSEKSGYLVYHFDQLGSTKRITDKDGKTVYTMNYGSYGELFGIKDGKGNLVNFKDNPIAFLYNGQYGIVTDQNTLTYMRARYYNPEIKRFINQDVLTGSIGNSQSLNRYSYVQGNPIRFTDPFGLCPNGSGTLSEFTPATKFILGLAHAAYEYNYEMTWQEQTHIACAVLGFVPYIGNAADVVDGYVYSTEGNLAEASFSYGCAAAGIVPGADQAAAVGKLLRVFDNVFGGAKAAKKIAKTRSLIKISGNIEDFAGIGREGTYLFDLAKGSQIVNKAADGAKVASHAADGIKAADNSIDAVRSSSNIGEAIPHTPTFAACFTADTRIKTKDGSKRIADIKVGDEVYSENPETGETGYQKVKEVFVTKTNTILTIKTQNETIETTKPHPFYVIGKGFVVAKDLQVGDHLKMANGEEAVIESLTLKHYKDPVTVYNFEVENWHTYHVSGSEVLVHNVATNPCANAGDVINGIPNNPGTVRRFMSKAEYKEFKKNGFIYDVMDTRGGISSTSTKVVPINPDNIKRSTGALGADYYVDIDVSNKNVFFKGKTKGGVADYKIQDNVSVDDIVSSGRVRK